MEINEIKQNLSILAVLAHYGLKPNKHNMLNCPFHEDTNASMKVYTNTNTFNCFGCGKNGDVIEFIQEKEQCSKHQALVKATELCGGQKPTNNKPRQVEKQAKTNHTEILTKLFQYFQSGLNHHISTKPKEYLQQRNLDYSKLEIGYNSGQFHHRGKLSGEDFNACIAAGMLVPYDKKTPHSNGQSYTPFAKDCIIFPLKNKKGEIVSIYGRSIINNDKSKHYYLKDRQGLYPGYPKPETSKLILTEAIIDAATLLQLPEITANYEILSLYGTNGLTSEHLQAIKELKKLEEIIFFFDGDQPGTEAIKKHKNTLNKLLPEVTLSAVETPDNEDINSLLQGHEAEILTHLLENRQGLLFPLETGQVLAAEKQAGTCPPPTVPEKNPSQSVTSVSHLNTANPSYAKLRTENPDFITYATNELLILVLGGINMQQLDRLRATLKINRTDTNDPLHAIRHTIDLYHSDYLEKFIEKASERLELGTNIVRRAMAELIEGLEQYRLSRIESMKQQKPKERQLTEGRYKRAKSYLSKPKLMERTNEDIGKTGVVGEETNRLLMYLVFSSRKREQPLHIICLGGSGTGKTYLQEKISELIPENDKVEITILSENAFYYFDRKELKHKLVLIEDMDGAMDVLYPLRELQTKKRINKRVPLKDSKGNMKTIPLVVEGPICLAGTTTREKLYEDNANRSLLIYLDNSKAHKEAIMDYQRKLSAGKVKTKEEDDLKEFFKDMQSILKPIAVRNPYAEQLKLPEYIFKPLRTNAHYLAVIETITFYHQYQREVKTDPETGERYIETTLEDIEWANKLLKDVLLAKADELPKAIRTFFEQLKNWLNTNKTESFYAKEIREKFRMSSSSCNRYILELLKNNYIKITGGNKYRQGFEYQVIKTDEYQELQEHVKNALDEALENIKKSVSQYPRVSQNKNGTHNQKKDN